MGEIISMIMYIILPELISEGMQLSSGKLKISAESAARQIYNKLASNSATREKLQEVYQTKNSNLLTQLVNQAGLSNQVTAIRKRLKEEKNKYYSKKTELDKENAELTNAYNKATNAYNTAGTSITGNMIADSNIKEVQNLINGGKE